MRRALRKLEARIAEAETVHSGPELVLVYAQLRVACERIGHALGQRDHDADRWIAATALRLGVPLRYSRTRRDSCWSRRPGRDPQRVGSDGQGHGLRPGDPLLAVPGRRRPFPLRARYVPVTAGNHGN